MNYTILFIFAICVQIASSFNCTQPAEITTELFDCCAFNSAAFEIIKDSCFQKETDEECMVQCFYKSHNFLDNDKVNMNNIKVFIKTLNNTEFEKGYVAAYEYCDKLGKEKITKKFSHLVKESKCNGYELVLDNCVALKAQTHCPKELSKNSPFCKDKMEHINNCVFN